MKLGRGYVQFGQQSTLERGERKPEPQPSEKGRVYETEGALEVRGFISTHRFPHTASHHSHEFIMIFAKDAWRVARLPFPIGCNTFQGCESRLLPQKIRRSPAVQRLVKRGRWGGWGKWRNSRWQWGRSRVRRRSQFGNSPRSLSHLDGKAKKEIKERL